MRLLARSGATVAQVASATHAVRLTTLLSLAPFVALEKHDELSAELKPATGIAARGPLGAPSVVTMTDLPTSCAPEYVDSAFIVRTADAANSRDLNAAPANVTVEISDEAVTCPP